MVNELRAVIQTLGGEPALGRSLRTEKDLLAAIREGFPQAVIQEVLQSSGLNVKELADLLDVSTRSLQRRRREGRLARSESDRIYRLARIVARAKHFLGDDALALQWLKRPNPAVGGIAPMDALDTDIGVRNVEAVLGRIAYGGIS